ncbi:MAG TPA: hypothetical protein VF894_10180 [Anaeromyxobacter sp.]
MPTPLAARRLEIHAVARADPAGFLRLEREKLRFSLGTSLADVAIPVEIAADARAIFRSAAIDIALLLSTHHRAFVPPDHLDRLILREEYANLPPVTAHLRASGGGPDLRAAAQLGPAVHPALTGGIVAAWMGKGGKGRSLVALWIELLQRAFAEMAETGGREETPVLVALALSAEGVGVERDVKECLPPAPLDRYLRSAALGAIWLAARTGLARAWRDAGRGVDDPLLLRIEAALSPSALLGGRGAVLAGGATLYGCDLGAGIPRADELSARLGQGGDAEAVAADVAAALAADEELARRAEQATAVARLRELLGAALAAADAADPAAVPESLRSLLCAPGGLAIAMAEEGTRRDLAARLAGVRGGGEGHGLLERAAQVVKAWKPKDPAQAVGLDRKAARAEYGASAAALLADLAVDRLVLPARRALSFRTGREAEGGTDLEWEGGRLYRLSARPGPLLRQREDRPAGHLFADVKDFTRRTALLGQASMAEFLRNEFYVPILVAAKEHFGGMQHLADRGGVILNNLVGDAISFSGRIDEMVALAKAIRAEFAAYSARLAGEISSDVVARQIAAIEAQLAGALRRARDGRAAQEAALASAAPGMPQHAAIAAMAARARAEEARLEVERDRALARAKGEVLEAGVFVSFGQAPLVVVIEDEVFGRNRVAIAEKINESARGTARAPAARLRADAALARERTRRRDPSMEHAWSVFVDQPIQLAVPPEAEDHAIRLFRAGDGPGAMRALAAPVRDGIEAAARGGERPGDVYNSGAAVSEEALGAFVAEVGRAREVRKVALDAERIPEALRARFFYGEAPLVLVACFQRDGRLAELFRRVGVAGFKGLGDVVVWELCADAGGAGALAAARGAAWFRGEDAAG